MTNQAWVANGLDGDRITAIAEATVTLIAEAIFHCGDVIGRVFDDCNMNGFQNGASDLIRDQTLEGGEFGAATTSQGAERGVPNARLVTPTGNRHHHGRPWPLQCTLCGTATPRWVEFYA